jgi:predicted CXXCH cytochrome family protein
MGGRAYAQNHSPDTTVAQCLACHPMALPTHPLWPGVSVPPSWPVGPGGQMICQTCHDCNGLTCYPREPAPQLCRACHNNCSQGMACLINTAHIGNASNIQSITDECLRCHNSQPPALRTSQEDHPVNITYSPQAGYRQVTDPRIVLAGGKITCITCHDPYQTTHARLVMPNNNSQLCLSCHIK